MPTALFAIALGLVAAGTAMIYLPAGVIAAGVGLALLANLLDAEEPTT